jgi:hypothetical protein
MSKKTKLLFDEYKRREKIADILRFSCVGFLLLCCIAFNFMDKEFLRTTIWYWAGFTFIWATAGFIAGEWAHRALKLYLDSSAKDLRKELDEVVKKYS